MGPNRSEAMAAFDERYQQEVAAAANARAHFPEFSPGA
jgi:hypothetical protein